MVKSGNYFSHLMFVDPVKLLKMWIIFSFWFSLLVSPPLVKKRKLWKEIFNWPFFISYLGMIWNYSNNISNVMCFFIRLRFKNMWLYVSFVHDLLHAHNSSGSLPQWLQKKPDGWTSAHLCDFWKFSSLHSPLELTKPS